MANIFADGIEINIEEGHWRLYNMEGANSLSPFFDVIKGKGLINYAPAFAGAADLPGTVLACDYLHAVAVGYDVKRNRWVLGLHVQMNQMDVPRFVQLVQWSVGDEDKFGTVCHQTGRILAEYIGCPLKLFGPKKTSLTQQDGSYRRGATGTLETTRKTDTLEKHRVQFKAELLELPITGNGLWVGGSRNSITLKITKEAEQDTHGSEAPKYRQVTIEKDGKTIRLTPQVARLGGLISQDRVIKGDDVQIIELRHTVVHESSLTKDGDGHVVDITNTHHEYGIYLNLAHESILLARIGHLKQGEVALHRVKTGVNAMGRDSYDPGKEMAFLRFHQQDQEQRDAKEELVESIAVVLASALDRTVVKAEINDQPE